MPQPLKTTVVLLDLVIAITRGKRRKDNNVISDPYVVSATGTRPSFGGEEQVYKREVGT